MTPQDVAAFTAVAALIKEVGTWPLFSIIALMQIGPWVGMLAITHVQGKRHSAAVQMYENNVLLVKGYEKLASDLTSIIHLNIQAQTRLVEKIENNMYCPVIREKGPRR